MNTGSRDAMRKALHDAFDRGWDAAEAFHQVDKPGVQVILNGLASHEAQEVARKAAETVKDAAEKIRLTGPFA